MTQETPELYPRNPNNTMESWSRALKGKNQALADSLTEDRVDAVVTIDRLGLPHLNTVTTDLPDFLQNASLYFARIGSEFFWVNIPPRKKGLPRFKQFPLSSLETLAFIRSKIKKEQEADYNIIAMEDYDPMYSGSILINDDNDVLVELVKGRHHVLSHGLRTPDIRATKTNSVFHYQQRIGDRYVPLLDTSLRESIFQTVKSIPHDGKTYLSCYGEFYLVDKGNGRLQTAFNDFHDNPVSYQVKNNFFS